MSEPIMPPGLGQRSAPRERLSIAAQRQGETDSFPTFGGISFLPPVTAPEPRPLSRWDRIMMREFRRIVKRASQREAEQRALAEQRRNTPGRP